MRVYIDENHPPALARVLAPLAEIDGCSVDSVITLELQGTKDPALFRLLADPERRSVYLTTDRAMSRVKHEIEAVKETGAIVVVGVKNWNQQKDFHERARHLIWWWPTVLRSVTAADRGSFLELPWGTSVHPLKRWRA